MTRKFGISIFAKKEPKRSRRRAKRIAEKDELEHWT